MTVIYLMRHSIADKNIDFSSLKESFENINRKYTLSIDGEKKSFLYSNLKELSNLNMVVSSNYTRCISTAKYMAYKNNLNVVVDSSFDERKFGVDDSSKIPVDFFKKQFLNHEYKLKNGESFDEVKTRAFKGLARVIKKNKNKSALIVTHSSTISFLLSKWCECEYNSKYIIRYKDKTIVDGFKTPDLIELKFNEKHRLESIRRVEVKKSNNSNEKKEKRKKKNKK